MKIVTILKSVDSHLLIQERHVLMYIECELSPTVTTTHSVSPYGIVEVTHTNQFTPSTKYP